MSICHPRSVPLPTSIRIPKPCMRAPPSREGSSAIRPCVAYGGRRTRRVRWPASYPQWESPRSFAASLLCPRSITSDATDMYRSSVHYTAVRDTAWILPRALAHVLAPCAPLSTPYSEHFIAPSLHDVQIPPLSMLARPPRWSSLVGEIQISLRQDGTCSAFYPYQSAACYAQQRAYPSTRVYPWCVVVCGSFEDFEFPIFTKEMMSAVLNSAFFTPR